LFDPWIEPLLGHKLIILKDFKSKQGFFLHLSLQEIMVFLIKIFDFFLKKPFMIFFGPHVQFDQNAILDKLFWTQPF